MNKEKNKEQIMYANLLKIFASIAVVVIHVGAKEWNLINANSFDWNVMNFYDSLSRWAVPVFIMITGMLLLPPEKEIPLSKIFNKYIKRIIILFMFWTTCYAILDKFLLTPNINTKYFIMSFINGHYHLWYLYMLIGLYIATPIIKLITKPENKKLIEYFLIIWFIFECILHTLIKLPIFCNLDIFYSEIHIDFFLGYVGYYILGYYLSTYDFNKIIRYIVYIIGIASIFVIILGTKQLKINDYSQPHVFYDFLSAPVCLSSIAVFTLMKHLFTNKKFSNRTQLIIKKCTKISLGVYLIHPAFIVLMQYYNISLTQWPVIISIPVTTMVLYMLSAILSYILSKIPIIGKLII